jgi:hypothetical protein
MAREVQVTFDAVGPGRLAGFWAEVLGYRVAPPPPGFATWPEALTAWGIPPERHDDASAAIDPDAAGPRLFFQRVGEGRTVENRVHLDVRAAPGLTGDERMAALEAECDRLVALGATRLLRVDPDPPLVGGHIVMGDPEGNEFCLD